jgi:uncharacterized protein (TIGR03086 family)
MSVDLGPATKRTAAVVRALTDDQLAAPTPCQGTVGDLLDHVQSFCLAFANAANKIVDETTSGAPPPPDASRLASDWRQRIPACLDALAAAWSNPAAWDGMTLIGGMEFPGEVAGLIALDEVALHGWDIAVATGQGYDFDDAELAALMPFLEHIAEPGMEAARTGIFGPIVPVADGRPIAERALGLAGRDPGWTP